ncbi:MAG: hypothetical protein DRQ37_08020 [Gammaproteobacteria bacterium]|nr:MAG: hypothetical protein DRQ37_08020 [Gammaproteobacteria bacterium]
MPLALILSSTTVHAGDVEVVRAIFQQRGAGDWYVSTTLRHADTGWKHYADAWRVVDAKGTVLGTRTLYHPHVDEQPFTRSLSLRIPKETDVVFVEAQDLVHGWSPRRIRVDLTANKGSGFEVKR